MTPEQQAALDAYLKAVEAYGQYTPEQLQAVEMGETGLAQVQYDPRMLEYEMSALRALEEQGREGLTAQDQAAIAQAERQAGQAARGRRGAIQQSMQQRGISGSGLDLVAQLQSAESANELAAMRALEQGALSAQRRSQGQQAAGQMAGQLGGRQYQQAAERAAAQDRIRQFNAQNRAQAQQYNIGMGAQTAANRMQAQTGAAQMRYNAAAEAERARLMREEERKRRRAGGLSAGLGALGAVGGALIPGGGPLTSMAGYQMGSALGQGIQGFADGGRVQPFGLGLNLPQPSDTVPAMLTPGEMVLPPEVSRSPDAAAAYVDAYTKAEQDVGKAKQMRDVLSYADIAAKGLSDYAQSQAPTTYLPRRFEELGKGPEAVQMKMPQYQAGSLAQLGEAGVASAKEGLGAAKEKFGMDTAMEKYKRDQSREDPTSEVSKRANLLLRAQIGPLLAQARLTGDKQGTEFLNNLARAELPASEAMQIADALKSGFDYKPIIAYMAEQNKPKEAKAAENQLKNIQLQKAQASQPYDMLPKEGKNIVDNLSSSNAKKISIKNQIDGYADQFAKAQSTADKLAIGRQMLKVLNSSEGADAIGVEEANRLGSALEFSFGNFTNSNPTQFGRNLKRFQDQVQATSAAIGTGIKSNEKIIKETYSKYGLGQQTGRQEIQEGQTVRQNGKLYKKVNGNMVELGE